MCMLCHAKSMFEPPIDPRSDLKELRRRAARVKENLLIFELESAFRKKNGLAPCDSTERRIVELRQEQFEIARRL